MKHILRHALSLLFFICFGLHNAYATTLTTRVDPPEVRPGQPFHLIYELDENAPAGLPDFSPLNHDFQIHGTAHHASYVFTDGQSKASTRWVVTLMPRKTGQLTIPAIQIGQARSTPQNIQVTQHPKPRQDAIPKAPEAALFIRNEVSKTKPLIHQQLIYTVKIYHNASILDAAYQAPTLGDSLVLPLGNNRQYQAIENGRPYLIEEQKYAFFPQKSGAQLLFPPRFQALIYDDIPRRVEAVGTSESIDVQAIPTLASSKTWLPAKHISLTEHYDNTSSDLAEGSTLTRTIMLKATGLPGELLPSIEISKSHDFNLYPEPPTQNTSIQSDDVMGSTTLKISYLFNRAGTITLPEYTMPWFNTETGQLEQATLPAHTFEIKADPRAIETNHTPPPEPEKIIAEIPTKTTISHALRMHLLPAIILASLTCALWLLHKRNQRTQTIRRRALKKLQKACLSHHRQKTHTALLAWAHLNWPDARVLNLDDIALQAQSTELTAELNVLSQALYNQNQQNSPWQGDLLWQTIKRLTSKPPARSHKKPTHLPPINPC